MKKIKIGNVFYDIEEWNDEEGRSQGVFGEHNPVTQIIRVCKGLKKDRKKEVLLHEILHAIWGQWVTAQGSLKEEDVVLGLGHGLTTVFMDNPKLKDVLF